MAQGEIACFARLAVILKRFNFTVDPGWNPKDLDAFPMSCQEGSILVEAVTPDGLVVTGPASLIAALRIGYAAEV